MGGEQLLQFVHLKIVILAAPRRVDQNKILAAVTCNRFFKIGGGVDHLDGES